MCIRDRIEGEVARAHLNGRVCCVRSIDIPVEELQQHDRLVKALIEESIDAITADGAQAVALGCTAMVDVAEDVQVGLLEKGYDIPVSYTHLDVYKRQLFTVARNAYSFTRQALSLEWE